MTSSKNTGTYTWLVYISRYRHYDVIAQQGIIAGTMGVVTLWLIDVISDLCCCVVVSLRIQRFHHRMLLLQLLLMLLHGGHGKRHGLVVLCEG